MNSFINHKIHASSCIIIILVSVAITMIATDTSYALKKTTKVGKVRGAEAFTYNGKGRYKYDKTYLMWKPAKRAKKYQIYTSNSLKGKYRKLKTVKYKKYKVITVSRPQGLVCYKVRGIRGKKKGKFSPVMATYGYQSVIENVEYIGSGESVMKIKIDNTACNSRDMVFFNNDNAGRYTVTRYDDYDDIYEVAGSNYCDSNGNNIDSYTIKANSTGYIYMLIDSYNAKDYFTRAKSPSGDVSMIVDQSFYIRDGKYKEFFDFYNCSMIEHGINTNYFLHSVGIAF